MWPFAGDAGLTRMRRREAYFNDCLPLFEGTRKAVTADGFARVAGRYRGRTFDLQAFPDALSYRKLPCLWLMVTITEPMPVTNTVNIMMRPSGTEVFSRFAGRPCRLAAPPGFPAAAVAHADAAEDLPPAGALAGVAGLFSDTGPAKELVVSPKGLRIVWLAEEADRTRYLIFRESEIGMKPAAPATLLPILDRLVELAATLGRLQEGIDA